MQRSGHSITLKDGDLFVKIVTGTEYDESLLETTKREVEFQQKALEVLSYLETSIKIGIPTILSYTSRVIVMENVKGIPINSYIKINKGNLKEIVQTLNIAMQELIKQGIYHNDLCQDNVLYDEEQDELWIIDFGMSSDKDMTCDEDQLYDFVF